MSKHSDREIVAVDGDKVLIRKRRKKKRRRKSPLIKVLLSILALLILGIAVIAGKLVYTVREAVNKTYTLEYPTTQVIYSKTQPFSTLLIGEQTLEGKKVLGVSLAVSVNPKTQKSTYANIDPSNLLPDGSTLMQTFDKGNVSAVQSKMQSIFSMKFNDIAIVDLDGLGDLVEALGGVSVENPNNFVAKGYLFKQGTVALTSKSEVSAYLSLLNKDDSKNFEARQQNVALAVMTKIKHPNIKEYQKILDAVSSNVRTSFDFNDFIKLGLNYRNSLTMNKMNVHSTAVPGTNLQQISQAELNNVVNQFKATLK